MPHTIEIKVRGYHLDGYGHVNNARWLEFLEEARWAVFEERMDLNALLAQGILFVVVNININYRRPAYLNNTLKIETELKSVSTHSAVLRQSVTFKDSGETAADADITFVLWDRNAQRPVKLTGEFAQVLEAVR